MITLKHHNLNIVQNPLFNMSGWGVEKLRQDARWKFGMPPEPTQQKTG